jgi:hypothetical protein
VQASSLPAYRCVGEDIVKQNGSTQDAKPINRSKVDDIGKKSGGNPPCLYATLKESRASELTARLPLRR